MSGWQIVGHYEDFAVSGATLLLRNGIQKLLARVEAGDIHIVLAINVNRISRDPEQQRAIQQLLREANCELWSCVDAAHIGEMETELRTAPNRELLKQVRVQERIEQGAAWCEE